MSLARHFAIFFQRFLQLFKQLLNAHAFKTHKIFTLLKINFKLGKLPTNIDKTRLYDVTITPLLSW